MPGESQQAAAARARRAPESFWAEAARDIAWDSPWRHVINASNPSQPDWFSGATLNTCFNAVDRHVLAGRGDQPALVFRSAMTGESSEFSYAALRQSVAIVAGALRQAGVDTGDRVIIYMPMIPEAIVAMLACARIGAIHSVVFGGFAALELSKRIVDTKPTLILTASCGLEPGRVVEYLPLVSNALTLSKCPSIDVIVVQRAGYERTLPNHWQAWEQWLHGAEPADCVTLSAGHPLYVLYTSGTTGNPKGVVRDNGGHAVALNWSMRHVFAVSPGDVFWAASDIGWVVGHSYIVYGPLIAGCTTVVFEGKPVGTPDAGEFWRVIEKFGVHTLFTAPTAIRAIRREDSSGQFVAEHNVSSLQQVFLAGERTDTQTLEWTQTKLQVPVVDNWWQTELGWPALAQCQGYTENLAHPGSAGRPVPGFDVRIVGEDHKSCALKEHGELVIRLPLPPGAAIGLWNSPNAFAQHYLTAHPEFYTTGDNGYVDADGNVFIMGRTDDLINVAGHRLSTGQMEEIVATVDGVAECAVVGLRDELKGQVPVALVVLSSGFESQKSTISDAIVKAVRTQLGPVAALKKVIAIDRLPKTRSGKVLRKTLRALADGESIATPPTIDDPNVLAMIRTALNQMIYEDQHDDAR